MPQIASQKKTLLGIIGIVLAAIIGFLGYKYYYLPRTPRYSLEQLAKAYNENNLALMEKYLDLNAIVESGEDSLAKAFQDTYHPAEESVFYSPKSRIAAMKKDPSRETKKFTGRIEHDAPIGEEPSFVPTIKSVMKKGNTAEAVIALKPAKKASDTDSLEQSFVVTMKQEPEGYWKITALEDAGALYRYVNEIDRIRLKQFIIAHRNKMKTTVQKLSNVLDNANYSEFGSYARFFSTLGKSKLNYKDVPMPAMEYANEYNKIAAACKELGNIFSRPGIEDNIFVQLAAVSDLYRYKNQFDYSERRLKNMEKSLYDVKVPTPDPKNSNVEGEGKGNSTTMSK